MNITKLVHRIEIQAQRLSRQSPLAETKRPNQISSISR